MKIKPIKMGSLESKDKAVHFELLGFEVAVGWARRPWPTLIYIGSVNPAVTQIRVFWITAGCKRIATDPASK